MNADLPTRVLGGHSRDREPPGSARRVEVLQLQRRPGPGTHSVERIFDDVRAALPADISVRLRVNRHPSRGLVPRLKEAWAAARQPERVRHILGDVHYLAWLAPRRGTILTILDCVTLERLSGVRRWVFWLLWYWLPVRRSEEITVISDFSAESLRNWVKMGSTPITIIPPTLSDEFRASPTPPVETKFRLLQVGAAPNKNLERVIAALAGLHVQLAIIGQISDDHRRLLAEAGIEYEAMEGLSREALVEQYHRAHIVVFASLYEGFGMPIIEAQAVGRPVVTSNRCSMPEAAGGAALLVDPEDVGAIRAAVQRLMTDTALVEALVSAGFENAERFRPAKVAEAYAALYRSVAARR